MSTMPKIDERNFDLIIKEIKNIIPYYTPEWSPTNSKDDFGVVLYKIYSKLLQHVVYKLNKVPERNFIEFLNVLGITLTPNQAAKVPATFTLSKGVTKNTLVPSGTELIAQSVSKNTELVFTTESDLLVTFAKILKVYSVEKLPNALDVKIYDHTDDIFRRKPFTFFDGNENLQKHILYIGHDDLFNIESTSIIIYLHSLNQENSGLTNPDNQLALDLSDSTVLTWEYDWQIDPDTGKEIPNSAKQMSFTRFDNSIVLQKPHEKVEELQVRGIKSRWIRCRLKDFDENQHADILDNVNLRQSFLNAMGCNPIENMEIKIELPEEYEISKEISAADLLFCDDIQLQKDHFYPFGKIPLNTSTLFYVASNEFFSKKDLFIQLSLHYEKKSKTHYDSLDILWEYWNGKGWMLLPINNSQRRFPENIWDVEFCCPQDIATTIVNGHENYWIRSRVDASNLVNKTRIIQKDNTFEVDSNLPILPLVESLKLSFSEKNKQHQFTPQHCLIYNNLEYEDCLVKSNGSVNTSIKSFKPFKTMDIDFSSILVGFDQKIHGGPVNLFLSISNKPNTDDKGNINNIISEFKYYCSVEENYWKKLDMLDNTSGFTKTGSIQSIFPSEFSQSKIFNNNLYWIAAKDSSQNNSSNIKKNYAVDGIYLNTIETINATRIAEEFLGSSDYSPNQIFKLKNSPIFQSPIKLWVNESTFVNDYEKQILLQQNKILTNHSDGDSADVWIMWEEVSSLYSSKPRDRHFTLDLVSGTIQFGDGIRGKIPPMIKDNLKIEYMTGGGDAGNIKNNELIALKGSVPFVKGVFNPLDGGGGGDAETRTAVVRRGPKIIQHRGQAVTTNDFESIIKEKFPSIAKIKCFENTDAQGFSKSGHVTVVLVQTSSSNMPVSSTKLLTEIREYLKTVSNVIIVSDQLHVIGPNYAKVSVDVTLYPNDINDVTVMEQEALKELNRFLDPLRGGFDQEGWEFGKMVSVSDIYKLFEDMSFVDHVKKLSLTLDYTNNKTKQFVLRSDEDLNQLDIDSLSLVCNGTNHNIHVRWEQQN